jgi:adenylate cyclase
MGRCMAVEIERKFLVAGDGWRGGAGRRLVQGYLSETGAATVRVRIDGAGAFLTIKGENAGAVRPEFEYPIPLADAEAILALCRRPLVEKTRYEVEHSGHVWEVDVFEGDNAGLVTAEVELDAEQEAVELPSWVGTEVTSDLRYRNSSLPLRDDA